MPDGVGLDGVQPGSGHRAGRALGERREDSWRAPNRRGGVRRLTCSWTQAIRRPLYGPVQVRFVYWTLHHPDGRSSDGVQSQTPCRRRRMAGGLSSSVAPRGRRPRLAVDHRRRLHDHHHRAGPPVGRRPGVGRGRRPARGRAAATAAIRPSVTGPTMARPAVATRGQRPSGPPAARRGNSGRPERAEAIAVAADSYCRLTPSSTGDRYCLGGLGEAWRPDPRTRRAMLGRWQPHRSSALPYDEFSMFRENADEFGIPWDGPPAVRREAVEVDRAAGSAPWCGAMPSPSWCCCTVGPRTPTPGTRWRWRSIARWSPSTCPPTATPTVPAAVRRPLGQR